MPIRLGSKEREEVLAILVDQAAAADPAVDGEQRVHALRLVLAGIGINAPEDDPRRERVKELLLETVRGGDLRARLAAAETLLGLDRVAGGLP